MEEYLYGTSGLYKAYYSSAKDVLQMYNIVTKTIHYIYIITSDYESFEKIKRKYECRNNINSVEYADNVAFCIAIDKQIIEQFEENMKESMIYSVEKQKDGVYM